MRLLGSTIARMSSSARVAPSDGNRVAGRAASSAATTIALVTVVGFAREIGLSFERSLPPWIVGLGLVGTVAIVAGAWATSGWQPQVSIGLAVASVGFFVPLWAAWPSLPNAARAASLAVAPFTIAGLSHVGLRWAHRARNGRTLWTIYLLVMSATIVHLLAYDAFADPGCDRTCLHADTIAGQLMSTGSAITISAALSTVAAGLGGAAIMLNARRRNSRLVTVSVLVALAAIAVDSALAASWIGRSERWGELAPAVVEFAIEAAAVAMLGVGVLAAVLAVRRTRVAIDRVVAQLTEPLEANPDPGQPVQMVEFAVQGEDRWVDAHGQTVGDSGDGVRSVVISDRGGPVLRFVMDGNTDAGELLARLTPASTLALRNAQLAAATRARLAEVQASRRRIVAASDAERRRIERDLHDGAQQRLVSVILHISIARNRRPNADAVLADAESTVHEALGRLRLLGHGIFPAVLVSEGLGAALEDLARASEIPTTVDVPVMEIADQSAMAAYAAVAAALAHASGQPLPDSAHIVATAFEDRLTVRVETTGATLPSAADLADIADRVGAIGGDLAVHPTELGFVLTAVVPCASS
jgi:signal transduction histidine kinase